MIFKWHEQYVIKNGRKYYYPGVQWDGFGLNFDLGLPRADDSDIFDPNSDWCIAFSDLTQREIRYNVQDIRKETLYDNNNRRYSLLFQCKIKQDQILFDDNNNNIVLLDEGYIVPYRLLRENIAD